MTEPNPVEATARTRVQSALARAQDALGDWEEPCVSTIDSAETAFDSLAESLADLSLAVVAMRDIPDLSREGALVAGSADMAAVVLRAALGSMQASLEAARLDAA